jgi:Calcineurin-like phosphoesterase
MGASSRRVAPLAAILAVLALALALAQGWFTSSDGSASGAFVGSDARKHVVAWAVGDGPDGGRDAIAVARLITRANPDRVLYLGDVYEHGTMTEFLHNFDPAYGSIAARTAPTPGNHDWPFHLIGYDPYWQKKHGEKVLSYYSFRTGGWQVVSLNSEIDHKAGSAQLTWLRSKVSGKGTCRIAFWHRPRYSAGTVHGDQRDVQPFWDALAGHATIVLTGHEHDMQRFKPRQGITELVSGAGGHRLYPLTRGRRDLAFGNARTFGALRLELTPGVARYRFVTAAGVTLDSGKVLCKPG